MAVEKDLKGYLESLVHRFERPEFILSDPISFPHAFDDPRDQEVIGLFAALLAWGRRDTLLRKLEDLCARMDYRPYAFVASFDEIRDGEKLADFKHRTFQPVDALWMTKNLQAVLRRFGSLEALFAHHLPPDAVHVGPAIQGFSETLMYALPDTPARLRKHLARPSTGSACKRLIMYLRWMVRSGPVDLGLWKRIRPDQLLLPLDVHSGRQARALDLLHRQTNDWKAVLELTAACRTFSPHDPARYDYAFFGPGAFGVPLDPRFITDRVDSAR
jgi:uncharacterized protein (TIGR02757 family)